MYTMTTTNGATKTFRTLTAAQEGAERAAFAELTWERYDENDGPRWLGFEQSASIDAVAEIREHGIELRIREAFEDVAEGHVNDVLSMGIIEPSGRDVEGWHVADLAATLEDADLPCEEEHIELARDVLAELIDEIAAAKREEREEREEA